MLMMAMSINVLSAHSKRRSTSKKSLFGKH
jgi:hypothetical protein